jgi:hypothetical protein
VAGGSARSGLSFGQATPFHTFPGVLFGAVTGHPSGGLQAGACDVVINRRNAATNSAYVRVLLVLIYSFLPAHP